MTDLTLQIVRLELIDGPGLELREDLEDEELQELAASVARVGLIHPPLLARDGERFRVVAGHRRVRACRLLGWREIYAVVAAAGSTQEAQTGLVENLHRRNLNPVEEAEAFAQLIAEHGYTPGQLAKHIGRSTAYVEERGKLLDWPEEIREAVRAGQIKVATARPLAQVDDPAERARLLFWAIKQGATAALTEAWLGDYQNQRLAAEARGGNFQSPGITAQPPEPTLQCNFCGEWKGLRDVEMLRACSACRTTMYGETAEAAASHRAPPGS